MPSNRSTAIGLCDQLGSIGAVTDKAPPDEAIGDPIRPLDAAISAAVGPITDDEGAIATHDDERADESLAKAADENTSNTSPTS